MGGPQSSVAVTTIHMYNQLMESEWDEAKEWTHPSDLCPPGIAQGRKAYHEWTRR